ncbi:MAG: hypothetical protein PHE25_00745 [Candidatus Gracilibacteria bacterium]|nr:hypothetical protein [Candidatus Gracilibacteria bacterium]
MFQNEKVIETKTCKHCNTNFEITDKDLEFYEKVSPVFGGKKYNIPSPSLCPDCRQQRRLSFRNERKLYKRKCDATKKDIISIYSPNKMFKVYDQDFWWSDNWDPMDYGRDFDFSKSFFEQFDELLKEVPLINLWNIKPEDSEYNNNCFGLKDSYMNFNSDFGKNNYYSYICEYCNDVIDCSYSYESNNCYFSFDLSNCYNCFYSNSLKDSADCYFSSDLVNCKYCFGSHSLRNTSYYWFGKKVRKEEWELLFKENHQISNLKINSELSREVSLKSPKKCLNNFDNENCLGDYISNSKNVYFSYDVGKSEDCKYLTYAPFDVKNVYDSYALGSVENGYECNEGGLNISNCCFVKNQANGLHKSFYTILCLNGSSNLFGCIGLKRKEYCVLNKQYTREQYEKLVPKIIEHMISNGEWGEFFPNSISPFGYNETVANEYFPLKREQALKENFNWSDYEPPFPRVDKIITVEMYSNTSLLEDANKVPDDILNRAIECEVTKKPFRIIKQELEFYRRHNLPIPRRHPDQRHMDRMALRNPRKLFDRKCDKCGKDIITTYSTERPEIVYCEECYNKEIY